jgi:hypothetical protein
MPDLSVPEDSSLQESVTAVKSEGRMYAMKGVKPRKNMKAEKTKLITMANHRRIPFFVIQLGRDVVWNVADHSHTAESRDMITMYFRFFHNFLLPSYGLL